MREGHRSSNARWKVLLKMTACGHCLDRVRLSEVGNVDGGTRRETEHPGYDPCRGGVRFSRRFSPAGPTLHAAGGP